MTYGRIAYEAYAERYPFGSHEGGSMLVDFPKWDQLSPVIREIWEAAAGAVAARVDLCPSPIAVTKRAAPELLAALEELLAVGPMEGDLALMMRTMTPNFSPDTVAYIERYGRAWEQARAAIRKARGEE